MFFSEHSVLNAGRTVDGRVHSGKGKTMAWYLPRNLSDAAAPLTVLGLLLAIRLSEIVQPIGLIRL